MKRKGLFAVVTLIVCVALVGTVTAQSSGPNAPQVAAGTAFTYQGQIERNNALFTGTCDMQFRLWDSAAAGAQRGATLNANAVNVDNGIFTVELDFGNQFTGDARWLEFSAKCADDADFTTLPRVALNPLPYALSLMPGAVVNGDIPFASGDATFKATNASTNGGTALFGQSTASSGSTAGVYGLASSPNGAGVWGHSVSGSGVYGQSTTSPGVSGKSASSRGVYGVSDTFIGVSGMSTSGSGVEGNSINWMGVYGESYNFEGVRGVSHNWLHGGVVGVNDAPGGTAVYATAPLYGYAMRAEGDASQSLNNGGWVKAMLYVDPTKPVGQQIVRCYNSQVGTNDYTSVPPCGFSATNYALGVWHVNFGFDISQRFAITSHDSLCQDQNLLYGPNQAAGLDTNSISINTFATSLADICTFTVIVY